LTAGVAPAACKEVVMNDKSSEAGPASVSRLAVIAYADACGAARAWGEGQASTLLCLLGLEYGGEIEALRDAAVHQAAVEVWVAATGRILIGQCLEIVKQGTTHDEQSAWEEDEDGIPYLAHRHRKTSLNGPARAATEAAAALRTFVEAVERSLDIDAALARYGLPER
jgi:hypothetical protein